MRNTTACADRRDEWVRIRFSNSFAIAIASEAAEMLLLHSEPS
jgi:hypothetical protein